MENALFLPWAYLGLAVTYFPSSSGLSLLREVPSAAQFPTWL